LIIEIQNRRCGSYTDGIAFDEIDKIAAPDSASAFFSGHGEDVGGQSDIYGQAGNDGAFWYVKLYPFPRLAIRRISG
jgi:hypothetical protein